LLGRQNSAMNTTVSLQPGLCQRRCLNTGYCEWDINTHQALTCACDCSGYLDACNAGASRLDIKHEWPTGPLLDIDITRSLHISAAPTNEANLLPTLPALPSNPPSCLSHAAFVGRRIIFYTSSSQLRADQPPNPPWGPS
jgi:hypothetical protein